MILRSLIYAPTFLSIFILLPEVTTENTGPTYDTGDWIPITPDKNIQSINREGKSSDRILNIDSVGEVVPKENKPPRRKPVFIDHRIRKNSHIKRSPNQRLNPKLEQPYRFETVLAPPLKHHQLKTFSQKIPFHQDLNIPLQYQFNGRNPAQNLGQQAYESLSIPSNHQPYFNLPKYSTIPLEAQYQHPNIITSISSPNGSLISNQVTNHQPFVFSLKPNTPQNSQVLPEDKDSVQLLYVPLEQLQKQQSFSGGILDDAFKSLQKQKFVSPPEEGSNQSHQPEALPLVSQGKHEHHSVDDRRQQPENLRHESLIPTKQEAPKYFELISKNQGELVIRNNQNSVQIPTNQQFQIESERQQIVELTSQKPIEESDQKTHFKNTELQNYGKQNLQPVTIQQSRGQFIARKPHLQQNYAVQQVKNPVVPLTTQSQPSYVIKNLPQSPQIHNYFLQSNIQDTQKSRLQEIQRDILQQTLEVEKLQKQIQQGKSIEFQGKPIAQKKKKPHQPPLAVYMGGNNQGDIEAVLEHLKNAKSIAVQDQIGPNSPQVFVGPSNLKTPDGFAKFPLPYLSSLDNNRIQRKAQQLPFFVAPLNYREPEGYSKIPLPSPHVGSVVISRFKLRENLNEFNPFPETSRPVPITNYQFVNPAFESVLENNSNFDDNLNAYSLDSTVPRENPNKLLKEQTLFQQITGFSGLEYPQNPYFQELHPEPELVTPDHHMDEKKLKFPNFALEANRVRGKDEDLADSKENNSENSEKSQGSQSYRPKPTQTQTQFQEVSEDKQIKADNIKFPSKSPLTQNYLTRFGPNNNNNNYNMALSTPDSALASQSNIEEIPANVRKLKTRPSQISPEQRTQPTESNVNFDELVASLHNSQLRPSPAQEDKTTHGQVLREFELPVQLTNINPNLPGLVNNLQDQFNPTTAKFESNPVTTKTVSIPTENYIQTTEATTVSSTTKKLRGRGRSRFNMKTTTAASYRRPSFERRRPLKTTTESHPANIYRSNDYGSVEREKIRPTKTNIDPHPVDTYRVNRYEATETDRVFPRTRLQNTLTERVLEASVESTPSPQQIEQTIGQAQILQNQQNFLPVIHSSPLNNRNSGHHVTSPPPTEGTSQVVEQYLSQKIIPAEQYRQEQEDEAPIRQISGIQSDRPESPRVDVTQKPVVIEKPTRRRVRVRGRPKHKYSSTTSAPRTTTPSQENEHTEFYGFFRQPNFSQSSHINNPQQEQDNIHIYAPTQQKTSSVHDQGNYESVVVQEPNTNQELSPHFVGELRPKYSIPSRTTTSTPSELTTTQRKRTRSRVRVPGRSYESRESYQENQSTEKPLRGRTRGKTHFSAPRNSRQEESNETENYPAAYLRSREGSTTPSGSEFKITVEADEDSNDQIPYSTINRAKNFRESSTASTINPLGNIINNEEERKTTVKDNELSQPEYSNSMSFTDKRMKQEGFRVVDIDSFDTAESQNYRSLLNSIGDPGKINELKSKEIDEAPTSVTPAEQGDSELSNTLAPSYDMNKLSSSFESPENVTNDEENTTLPLPIMSTTEESSVDFFSTISSGPADESENITLRSSEEELKINTSTEAPNISVQSMLEFLSLQTSTSTEISHETEICYKGKCVKSRNRKLATRPAS